MTVIRGLAFEEGFEGHIAFVKKTHFDTLYINYYVKGEKVRINQYTSDGILLYSLLADLESETVVALEPAKKMYRILDVRKENQSSQEEQMIIKKTGNYKFIDGVKCLQWRVRDRETNSEIAYWVTQNNLQFMNELAQLLSNTDRIYEFFSYIPSQKGYFPILTIERTLLRKERQRFVLQDINPKIMNEKFFQIPSGYINFSR
jgi:hypothetical protein